MNYTHSDHLQLKFAEHYSMVSAIQEVRLGRITWRLAFKGTQSIDAQLIWIEPFIWALQKLRWTPAPRVEATNVEIRERTCSWLELGMIIHILTSGNGMPHNLTFGMCAAITRNLWIALSKFFRVHSSNAQPKLPKKEFAEIAKAGALITCGIPGLKGLSKRPITDDFPRLTFCLAALAKFAATNVDKQDAAIPLLSIGTEVWKPTGLLETAAQLRERLEIDSKPGMLRKRKRDGPCVFGCQPKATLSQGGSLQWYAVPSPSPWPGVSAGETLCKRCYSWSRTSLNKKQRAQKQCTARPSGIGSIVDRRATFTGIVSRPELNGTFATVCFPEDDNGRVTVKLDGTMEVIRVARAKLFIGEQQSEGGS